MPEGFVNWLIDVVVELEIEGGKGFSNIAEDLGVQASILSRWIGGMGLLSQNDIHDLVSKLGSVVYTYLHIPRPDKIKSITSSRPYVDSVITLLNLSP